MKSNALFITVEFNAADKLIRQSTRENKQTAFFGQQKKKNGDGDAHQWSTVKLSIINIKEIRLISR